MTGFALCVLPWLIATAGITWTPENAAAASIPDPRHISNGWEIPSEGYADQPYIVKTDDGAWLCVMTTGHGAEGARGQHVVSMRSADQGRNWEQPVAVEPANGPEASYAVLLKVGSGRIYAFYNHNTDRVREVKREDGGVYNRVDSLGHYVFKYTDDHGRTWSAKRYEVPVREFDCDRTNIYGGKLRFFWNVGRPLVLQDAAILVLHKVGAMGAGFFAQSEGAFLKSGNILTEHDPEKLTFETLPDGNVGLRAPEGGGRVAEEQSIVKLSDGSIFCVYRTIDGWPACAYSRDGGRTWTKPAYLTYTPGGRRVKHPRAANFVWDCGNERFLYWFHNHGGRFIRELGPGGKSGRSPYDGRNPAWLMAGRETRTPQGLMVEWSQPEIFLYDDDPFVRISYPDLVEDGGKFYVTETQKTLGRVHEIPMPLLDGLFSQFENRSIATNGLALDVRSPIPPDLRMPVLPEFQRRDTRVEDQRGKDLCAGFSIDLWFQLDSLVSGQMILDSRDADGRGLEVATTETGTLRIRLNDGRQQASWESDRGALQAGPPQHVVITVDGGPKIITFVVNGVLCDGGDERQFGWGRFSPTLRTPNGATTLKQAKCVQGLRIYARALRTSEAVGNFRAGLQVQIDKATLDGWSAPYRGWHYYADPIIPSDFKIPGHEKFHSYDCPTVYQVPGRPGEWFMSFIGFNGQGYNSFVVESTNLVSWTNPRLAMGFGPPNQFDHGGCAVGAFLYESCDIKAPRLLKKRENKYWTLYGCYPRQGGYELRPGYEGVAVSEDGLSWTRAKHSPILSVHDPACGSWEKDCIYQPWLVEHDGRFYDFYNAANGGTEQMGGATSTNLLDWQRYPENPIVRVSPEGYNAQFCSDGKVFWDGDHWVMFYFGVGKGGAHIMCAFSRDLRRWVSHPEPLYKAGGHPGGLDSRYAHKISLVYHPADDTYYLYYCAVGNKGRCIGLLTSRKLARSMGSGT